METQTINLKEIVSDPDDDPLSFKFNSPFDSNGEWQTGFDDGGSFVTVFEVNDGEFTEMFRVEVSVLNTNQAPEIISTFYDGKILNIEEDETLEFDVQAVDGDNDELSYHWKFNGEIVGEGSSGEDEPG